MCLAKPKIFTIWPFTENVCPLQVRALDVSMESLLQPGEIVWM